jgi:putative transposase
LMREEGLKGKVRRRCARTTDSNHSLPVFPNLLNRDFTATGPNRRWVGDITYLRTPNGFIYLAAVLDLYSRAIVGWAVSAVIDRHLVIAALEMAVKRRCPGPGLLHHSDQGSQYASDDYQSMLDEGGITCSMSRRGDCYDNAAMESWFGILKTELGEHFASPFDAKRQLFDYIEVFYNRKRIHSSLGYLSPAEFERNAQLQLAA